MPTFIDTLDIKPPEAKTAELAGGYEQRGRQLGRSIGIAGGAIGGGLIGGALGLPVLNPVLGAVIGGTAGAGAGSSLFGGLGGLAGRGADALRSDTNYALREAESLPLEAAWDHLHNAESHGASPETLEALRDSYNKRRHEASIQTRLATMGRGL